MKKYISLIISLLMILSVSTGPAYAEDNTVLNISSKDSSYKISDKLYGLFIEDISYACDGGLVSNLVNNGSFEYQFNNGTGWSVKGLDVSFETSNQMSTNNPCYATITVDGKGTLTNLGYTEIYDYKSYDYNSKKANTADMGFKENTPYDFSCYIRNEDFDGTVRVYLDSSHNSSNITELDISRCGNVWNEITTTLTSVAKEDGGLTIEFNGKGTINLDFVSLIPQDSYGYGTDEWKYVSLRPDLYQALENLSPSFVRFPGGCLAEGDSLDNLYNWKNTIGPLEERKQFYNLWRDDNGRDYINTMAMGYHEYFQLCSDLQAEPLPILNVGLTCQPRADYGKMEKDYLDKKISAQQWEDYLDTIALRPGTSKWEAYVQDVLDLIEYANGDATTTYWGALRAANGSVKPFNLKYIGLGNENYGIVYERNFRALYDEVKKAYPEITIISSSGMSLEGKEYDENWSWISKDFKDTVVDEHYYTYDSYLFDHNDRYDSFDRNGAHVFVGEYAPSPSRLGTIETKANIYGAVEAASYLTGIERNADIVDMISYAPTFAKINAQSWDVNMIWFDSQELVLSPNYYVQQIFANNYGSEYVCSTFENNKTIDNGIYESVTVDKSSQTLYIKLVNTSGENKSVNINLSGYDSINYISAQSVKGQYKSACNELGKNAVYPTQTEITAGNSISIDMDKYEATVIRVVYGNNNNIDLYSLPNAINTVSDNFITYYPPAISIGVPCGVAGAAVIIGAVMAIAIIIKKKKSNR